MTESQIKCRAFTSQVLQHRVNEGVGGLAQLPVTSADGLLQSHVRDGFPLVHCAESVGLAEPTPRTQRDVFRDGSRP